MPWAQASLIGARSRQEDHAGVERIGATLLLVLADGMGGHADGAEASALCVRAFCADFRGSSGPPRARLMQALRAANAAVAGLAAQSTAANSPGATLVAVLVEAGQAFFISVGDSPLWRARDGVLTRCNADHSMRPVVEAECARGEITPQQARSDPRLNMLRSAVMGETLDLVDLPVAPLDLAAGDFLLLASDGVESLSPEEIAQLAEAAAGDPDRLAQSIMSLIDAKAVANQDNATVVVYLAGKPAAPAPGRAPAARGRLGPLTVGLVALAIAVVIVATTVLLRF